MSQMIEISEQELIRRQWQGGKPFAVYFYTPWCGTCKVGEKMLNVALVMSPETEVWKANVNFLPELVQRWRIESVPCLAFVEDKRVTNKVYTMRSVEHVLEQIRAHAARQG